MSERKEQRYGAGFYSERRLGEKVGWIGGWLGAFSWLLGLALVWFLMKRPLPGILAVVLFGFALLLIYQMAPWHHPSTPYCKLMIPLYITFLGTAIWTYWNLAGLESFPVFVRNPLTWLCILPCAMPFFTIGGSRWVDGEHKDETNV